MSAYRLGFVLAAVLAVGCSGSGDGDSGGGGGSGGSSGASVVGGQAGASGSGGSAGSGGTETCESSLLCGTPSVCCDVGDECFEGACVPPCASGIRCGGDGSVCCMVGDVCLASECATPGASCTDSFDCPEGHFCEPTLSQCLPQPTGPLCELRPESVTFEPTIEWHWD